MSAGKWTWPGRGDWRRASQSLLDRGAAISAELVIVAEAARARIADLSDDDLDGTGENGISAVPMTTD